MQSNILWNRVFTLYSLTNKGEISADGDYMGIMTICHNCLNRIPKDFSLPFKSREEEWREFPHHETCVSTRDYLVKEFEKEKMQSKIQDQSQ